MRHLHQHDSDDSETQSLSQRDEVQDPGVRKRPRASSRETQGQNDSTSSQMSKITSSTSAMTSSTHTSRISDSAFDVPLTRQNSTGIVSVMSHGVPVTTVSAPTEPNGPVDLQFLNDALGPVAPGCTMIPKEQHAKKQ